MKKNILAFILLLGSHGVPNPDSSAMLELKSIGKGFLLSRLTTVQRDVIAFPVSGLSIYNITENCTEWYDGT